MLIVAQPRSASTSLLYTMSEILKIKPVNGLMRVKKAAGYSELQRLHRIIGERTKETIKNCIQSKNKIYRLHLLPIEKHLKILDKIDDNFILLLRDPEKTLESYMKYCKSLQNNSKLRTICLKDLYDFHNKWVEFAINKKNILIVHFSELIQNERLFLRRIADHLGHDGGIKALKKLNMSKDK